MHLTPAEQGLVRRCNKCGERLALDHFYVSDSTRLRSDGRRIRMNVCTDCHNARTMRNGIARGNRDGDPRYNRARSRARTRLTRMVPELYEQLLNEELRSEGVDPDTRRRARRSA